jgi:ABC-type glycerol-3-phosphate transport system substrate-binding protein
MGKKMKKVRFLKANSMILVIALLMGTLSGCIGGKDEEDRDTNNNEVAMGRYVEKDFEYPEGVGADNYRCLLKNPEGNLELFTYNNDIENETDIYSKFEYKDGVWIKDDVEELDNTIITNSLIGIKTIFYGEDGKQYITGYNDKYNTVLYKRLDDGKYEQILIPKFEEEYEDLGIACDPDSLEVLKNGMIAAMYFQGEIEVYSPDGKTVVSKFDSGKMAVEENNLYYTSENGSELLVINMDTNKEGVARTIDTELSASSMLEIEDGTAYLCNSAGIHQNKEGGSIWETIVDGALNSLSSPSNMLMDFLIGTMNDYYMLIYVDNSKVSLMHYVYDENVASIPSQELTIYSLQDSNTIRQAIVNFQKNNPEVLVTFRVAGTDGGAATTADYIKALNTELLAKKGADILVLDGLPIESYIEKGVLEDMGSFFTPMVDSEELLSNIANNYIEDGKVYAMPARYTVPVIYGRKDAVKAAASFEELAIYSQTNTDIPLLTPGNHRALAELFLFVNYNDILNEKNEIDETLLTKFLENLNKIAVNTAASEEAEQNTMNSSRGAVTGYWVSSVIDVGMRKVQANIEEVGGVINFAAPLTVLKEQNGSYSSINHMFRANTLTGINKSGSQKELAKEFVKLLFTEEIQKKELGDGFPINKAASEEWEHREIDRDSYFTSISSSESDYRIDAQYPSIEETTYIFETLASLTTPIVNDSTMIGLILDETERFLKGELTAEQAAKNASGSIKTYLAE